MKTKSSKMKAFTFLLFLFSFISSFGQTYKAGALLTAGTPIIKYDATLELTDSMFTIITDGGTGQYRVISKGLNNNFKLSDGVRECALNIINYEKPMKFKGKEYYSWLIMSSTGGTITYYCNELP